MFCCCNFFVMLLESQPWWMKAHRHHLVDTKAAKECGEMWRKMYLCGEMNQLFKLAEILKSLTNCWLLCCQKVLLFTEFNLRPIMFISCVPQHGNIMNNQHCSQGYFCYDFNVFHCKHIWYKVFSAHSCIASNSYANTN